MSILVQVLVLSACLGDVVHTLQNNMLKESITLLDQLQQMEVSCNQLHVANIFADHKRDNNTEIFCKAATIARESRGCHRNIDGIYYNLLSLVWERAGHRNPCPVPAGSTTSLKNFFEELHQVLQEEFKTQN